MGIRPLLMVIWLTGVSAWLVLELGMVSKNDDFVFTLYNALTTSCIPYSDASLSEIFESHIMRAI